MDKVIKEGALRVLISESTCDVILSCKDHRLMAHKLILSIASPVFRELLRKNSTDSTSVIIVPDISSSIMSKILDYIYTGTTVVYSNSLQEFLSVASFLQIAVDTRNIESVLESLQKVEDVKKLETESNEKSYKKTTLSYCKMDVKKHEMDCTDVTKKAFEDHSVEHEQNLQNQLTSESRFLQTKVQKRLPDLLPISSGAFKKHTQRKLCNVVVPSPWCQRNDRNCLGDPREVTLKRSEKEIQKQHTEDTNNNFQLPQNSENPKCSPKSLDSIIRHLYLSNIDSDKRRTADKNSTTLGEDFSKKRDSLSKSSESYQKDTSLPDPSTFTFSQKFADFKRFKSKNKLVSTDSKLSPNNNSGILSTKCSDNKTQRTFFSDYSLEPKTKNISPLDFVQNLSLPKKNTSLPETFSANLPPSNILTHDFSIVSNNALVSPKNLQDNSKIKHKKATQIRVESNTLFNENSNSNDVSNDNSMSNDSSGDEKRDEDISVKKKSYKCEDCGKTFSQLRNYKYHRSVHEGTKEFSAKCTECGKMFNDRGYLSSHMKIHRDRKEYACPNCPKRFNQRVAYNMHLRIHTGIKPHECPTCGKSFSRKMLLKQHQRVHTGERPYTCPECGKTFADRSNMSLHARLHTGVKPYGCSLCPKSFTKKHHLKTHMNFHTGLKPYNCENCGLAFSQSSNMRTHYKKCILKESASKSTKAESVSSAENNSS